MPSTGLKNGPFPRSEIDKHVKKGRSIGVYTLGYLNEKSVFIVRYVGRSDHHDEGLNARLHEHDGVMQDCTHFKFGYLTTPKEAFERESTIFHDFNLATTGYNTNHPPRPEGENYRCPVDDSCFAGDQEGDDDSD